MTDIKKIIEKHKGDIAFVVGNGINRYLNDTGESSWEDLLSQLWKKVSSHSLTKRPEGISLPEFYDILELKDTKDTKNIKDSKFQKEVAKLMKDWVPRDHHKNIINRIKELNAPVLTTNFENTLAKTSKYRLFKIEQKGFGYVYPWTTFYGENKLESPTDGFGIWHINGMIKYHRSIRLGLSHYMGSVEKARRLLHKGEEKALFSGKNTHNWNGCKTWLHIVFNKSLFIFGLGLEENETFLRWLLIERSKYFKHFPRRKHKGWYINKKNNNETDQGKKFFLENVGFKVIEVDDYADIYENIWK